MPLKYVHVDGVATHLRHTGPTTLPEVPPELKRGQVVVCLHHAGGNGGNFAGVLARLESTHSPLAFDFPGHDRSGSLDSLGSVERLAEFTGALLDTLGVGSAVLLGHDLGAAVALQVALDRPEAVRALVLCGAAARFDYPAEALERARLVTEGKARREFDPSMFSPKSPPAVMRAGFMDALKTDPRVVYPNLLASRDWSGGERLASVRVPSLVVAGKDEAGIFAGKAADLASRLPDAQLVEIEQAGHLVPIEQPDALADAVLAFLEGLS